MDLIFGFTILVLFTVTIMLAVFPFIGAFFGAPFSPSKMEKVKKMVAMAGLKKGMTVVDLGAGDGRIIEEAARNEGIEAHAVELNPILTFFTSLRLKKKKNIKVINKNMWKVDLSIYDRVFVFCMSKEMAKFENKLKTELKPGSLIISNIFQFPNWKSMRSEDSIYVYKV